MSLADRNCSDSVLCQSSAPPLGILLASSPARAISESSASVALYKYREELADNVSGLHPDEYTAAYRAAGILVPSKESSWILKSSRVLPMTLVPPNGCEG